MFKIDPDYWYTFDELDKNKVASRSTLYRRSKAGELKASKNLNGEPVVKGEEILNFLKKHPIAS